MNGNNAVLSVYGARLRETVNGGLEEAQRHGG